MRVIKVKVKDLAHRDKILIEKRIYKVYFKSEKDKEVWVIPISKNPLETYEGTIKLSFDEIVDLIIDYVLFEKIYYDLETGKPIKIIDLSIKEEIK